MKTELEKYQRATEILFQHITAQIALGHLCAGPVNEANQILQLVQDLVNPPPATEEVEVVRYYCPFCGRTVTESEMKDGRHCVSTEPVKLTGTLTREVPQKVERSVSVEGYRVEDGFVCGPGMNGAFHGKKEAFGKTGTLTFTWHE